MSMRNNEQHWVDEAYRRGFLHATLVAIVAAPFLSVLIFARLRDPFLDWFGSLF